MCARAEAIDLLRRRTRELAEACRARLVTDVAAGNRDHSQRRTGSRSRQSGFEWSLSRQSRLPRP